jgi:hypothetical protein
LGEILNWRKWLWRWALGAWLLTLAAPVSAIPKACRGHGGVADCDSSGQTVCEDGTLDMRFTCSRVGSHKKIKRVLKFKAPPNRGQILKPGETPPSETLQQSQKEMRQ